LGALCGRTDRTGLDTGLTKKQLIDANITGNARRCDLSYRTSLPHAQPIRFFMFSGGLNVFRPISPPVFHFFLERLHRGFASFPSEVVAGDF